MVQFTSPKLPKSQHLRCERGQNNIYVMNKRKEEDEKYEIICVCTDWKVCILLPWAAGDWSLNSSLNGLSFWGILTLDCLLQGQREEEEKKECACPEKLLKVRPLVLPTSLHEICANYVNDGKRRRSDKRATSKHEDIYFPTYNDDLGTWVVRGPGCVSANDMFRTTIATCLEALTRQMKNDSQLLQPTKVHMMGSVASSSSKIRCTQENYLNFWNLAFFYLRIGNDMTSWVKALSNRPHARDCSAAAVAKSAKPFTFQKCKN